MHRNHPTKQISTGRARTVTILLFIFAFPPLIVFSVRGTASPESGQLTVLSLGIRRVEVSYHQDMKHP